MEILGIFPVSAPVCQGKFGQPQIVSGEEIIGKISSLIRSHITEIFRDWGLILNSPLTAPRCCIHLCMVSFLNSGLVDRKLWAFSRVGWMVGRYACFMPRASPDPGHLAVA